MNPIRTLYDLKNYHIDKCRQFWYYVILVNPRDLSAAGAVLFENLNIFHLDSGADCHYFIPGFYNTGTGLLDSLSPLFHLNIKAVSVPGFRRLNFDDSLFVEAYKQLEFRNRVGWRYSGGCELLLFNINSHNEIQLDDFASYNLDDIVRNGRSVSEFIRTTISVGKDSVDQIEAKRKIDEKYSELIMPKFSEHDEGTFEQGWNILSRKGFQDNAYLFISYSSKDFKLVSEIRNKLCRMNIPCWMAPFDIPSGTNYAYVIEHAIKHAGKFVLMLSRSAVDSIWVGKELKRALDRFQISNPEKICVVWLDGAFPLNDTPFALPLEDVQISIDLCNNPDNYCLLTDM